ncbi:hypothetical protein CC1G_04148 [Coprinopsis cinerea okayama7|uniref:Uncharacterized protein n=1 Tax=Coprinopsis cinerea (strain Okayama-7 / 130 / ATCC MYA-4618 / FGSC 9003) TaxID=240176 RepID=A8NW57_COPC7|nr:hypothetical protein CC1G_04148 [Coprinopsis cinerea okayama7\|eukprot:XP_001836835.2 hypothetical protein CC1G_04148 [Coprinopsis cinerea okayama7\
MSREPFEVPELIEHIASHSRWSLRDIAAFRLSGRIPSIVGRRLLLERVTLHGHFDVIDGRLLLSRIDALADLVRSTPSLAPLVKRVCLSSWGADSGWLRSDALKRALTVLCEGGGATELSIARLGVEESLGFTLRGILRVSGSSLIRLRVVHVLDVPKAVLESCVNLQDLNVDGLRMIDSGPDPNHRPSLTAFRYSHSSGIALANVDHSPDPIVSILDWSQLRLLVVRLSWYRDVRVLNHATAAAQTSLEKLELEVSSFHRNRTRPGVDPVLPMLPEVREVHLVLTTHYHYIRVDDCPPSAFALFVGLLDCPRLRVLHLECVFGALLRRRYIYTLRWHVLDAELARLGKYGRIRVELDFVYSSSFNIPSWDPVYYDEMVVFVEEDFLVKYFPLTVASDSIELVLV